MKESCYTRQDILFNAKTWCQKHNVRLIGAPFETDSQEVADDEIFHGITKASCTFDSDLWVLGSKAIVDNLSQSMDNNGVTGKCYIIRRDGSLLTPALLDMDAPAHTCLIFRKRFHRSTVRAGGSYCYGKYNASMNGSRDRCCCRMLVSLVVERNVDSGVSRHVVRNNACKYSDSSGLQ